MVRASVCHLGAQKSCGNASYWIIVGSCEHGLLAAGDSVISGRTAAGLHADAADGALQEATECLVIADGRGIT